MADFYSSLGVSAEKGEVHAAIKKQDAGLFPGAFCKVIADPAGSDAHCSALHADGAGTKSALAYLYWKETGDITVFEDLAQDAVMMNIDDLACIGATDGFLLSNTIGRSAKNIPGEIISRIIDGYDKCIEMLKNQGVDVTLCGGETADVGDLTQTVIVDSTVFCRLEKKDVIDCDNVRAGDVIVGFASHGKAPFEARYNAGMGSNGLTAARHLLLSSVYRDKYPETYSPFSPKENVYCGKYFITDPLEGTDVNIGQAILSPTRPYAGLVKALFAELGRAACHGFIHCTGGGQTKCRKFGKKLHYIKDDLMEIPPLFRLLTDALGDMREAFMDFNMGHRLELFCSEADAERAISVAKNFGIDAKVIGRVEESIDEENHVTIRHAGETYTY
ncbi:MAG: phosphoribosylformylglycinamidine cyclo-ligase [Clostridia bacterium]|nr:phosphoribosylformylglycinamidine cyclo-ligase [Clostridia bacterium]